MKKIILLLVLVSCIGWAADLPENTEFLHRHAKVERVVDGDTMDVLVKLGFDVLTKQRLRLYGVDTPEKFGAEKIAGRAATLFVKEKVEDQWIIIKAVKRGKYGRFLAEVWYWDYDKKVFVHLNSELVRTGHAKEYHGGKRK